MSTNDANAHFFPCRLHSAYSHFTINKTLNSSKFYETAQFNEAYDVILAVEALAYMQDQLVDRNTPP